jgi:NAD+ diphosphatase
MRFRNVYTCFDLDRCDRCRGDEAWVAERLADPETRLVAVWRGQCLTTAEGAPNAYYCDAVRLAARFDPEAFILLGVAGESAYFAIDLSHEEAPLECLDAHGAAVFEDLRKIGPGLPPRDSALYAYARAMAHWHSRHRFCGVCGTPTRASRAGHVRRCENPECGIEHFPRTDPAVITLVTHGDAALFARQERWAPNRYAVLAGFVEPGEDLEHAVVREVFEEVGLDVTDVVYHSSQPWPFPASLMIGFTARAKGRDLEVDHTEIEHAQWLTRDEVHERIEQGTLVLSPNDSISRRLVDEWLRGEL